MSKIKHKKIETVYVAMSGGVDSSVAAALLKKQSFNVVGVFFKPWQPKNGLAYCNWQQDREDALCVASILGIPFKTWDFSREYGRKVTKYMIDSYRRGITPNPDVMCNKEIKFGIFLKRALRAGADYIATGHYARIRKVKGEYQLLTGRDANKDQSYFLYTLTQKELRYCLFPIGEYEKPEVRKLAKRFSLPNFDKKDSQGVCFIGQLDMKQFLKLYIKPRAGDIRLIETDAVIGRHDGAQYYTIGQRHGLDVKDGNGPYFVVSKNMRRNIIYVTNNAKSTALEIKNITLKNMTWVGVRPQKIKAVRVKLRYRTSALSVTVKIKKTGINLQFTHAARAAASGQSAVLYKGQQVLGGGIIK